MQHTIHHTTPPDTAGRATHRRPRRALVLPVIAERRGGRTAATGIAAGDCVDRDVFGNRWT